MRPERTTRARPQGLCGPADDRNNKPRGVQGSIFVMVVLDESNDSNGNDETDVVLKKILSMMSIDLEGESDDASKRDTCEAAALWLVH